MYFEDKEDYIEDSQNLDDTISWDAILDTDEDGIVSIKNQKTSSPSESDVYSDADSGIPDINSIDLGDGLSIVEDNDIDDEEELKRILGSDDNGGDSFDNETTEELNMDNTSEQVEDLSSEEINDEIIPGKDEDKTKQNVSPILLILLAVLIIAGVSSLAYFYFVNRDEDDDIPQVNTEAINQDNQNGQAEQNENIPVVNEDEVGSLKVQEEEKKEEEEKEEKKEIVNVVPTGRTDPFLPLRKYTKAQEKVVNTIDYDSVKLPFVGKSLDENTLKHIESLKSIKLSGIMYDPNKPSAIITYNDNDYFVLTGDKLDDFRVVAIEPSCVKIAYGKNIYTARLGGRFVVNDFYGNNTYQSNSRQYYSSEDEYYASNMSKYHITNEDRSIDNGYASNEDIGIYKKDD